MGNINLFEIFALILTISASSAFNLRKIGNDNLEQQQKNGAEVYSRIYGGGPALPGEFKYQVGLRIIYADGHHGICGGSLVSGSYVLTAAQCVQNGQKVIVYIRSRDLDHGISCDVGMHNVSIHPDYDSRWRFNNIASIKIPRISESRVIKFIGLPRNNGNKPSYAGAATVLAGWGVLRNPQQNTPELHFVNLRVITHAACVDTHQFVDGSKLCATAAEGGGCTGDSGSPLVLGSSSIPLYQIGIFSTTECWAHLPSVFTRIDHHFKWIKDNTDLNI